jgi:hypothetical protein
MRDPLRQSPAMHPFAVFLVIFVLLLSGAPTWAGDGSSADRGNKQVGTEQTAKEPPPIQDNSFLIEVAYNQEFGVVQHINTFTRSWNTHDWVYTFTQEWSVPGQAHQLSYTLSYLDSGANPRSPGIGDVAINYCLVTVRPGSQLHLGSLSCFRREIRVSAAGRSANTLCAPECGSGYFPGCSKRGRRARATATGYNLGQSLVWLARPRFNVLFETLWTRSESVVAAGPTQRSHDLLLSPGIRWAHNFANRLQVVPGIGFPIGIGPSVGERGVFLYLSFEHPFRELRTK